MTEIKLKPAIDLGGESRFSENWQEYHCADCDPAIDEDAKYEKPYVLLVPEGETLPDHCPRCMSYLGLIDGKKGLRVAEVDTSKSERP